MDTEPFTFKTLFHLAFKHKKALLYGQLITFFAIVISIPIPLMLPAMVDEVLLEKPAYFLEIIEIFIEKPSAFTAIAIVTFAVVFLRLVYLVFTVINTKIFTHIAKYITYMLRKRLIQHLKYATMNEYETLGSGAITSNLITDINTLDSFLITTTSRFVTSVLTLIGVGVVMMLIDPYLGLLILVIQPLVLLLNKKMIRKVSQLKKVENKSIEEFQENFAQTLELYGQIKASNKENYFFDKAIKNAQNIQNASNNYGYKNVAYERFSYTIFLIVFELLRAAGLLLVAYSDLSIGMMFAMFGYIWFIMTPVQDILSMQYSYASAKAALERINTILDLHQEKNGTKTLQDTKVSIRVEDLCFSYAPEKQTLKNISLFIPMGAKIALIGSSGSGKTTLAQILAGFYEKQSGTLSYNQIPIEELNKSSLRQKIFLVLQMPILFNDTLHFNLTMGDQSISLEQIQNALEIAELAELLAQMPQGLNTIVGRHGIRLSGGQRQRLSIARMILADPSVVIFDESTSALDVHTEAKIQAKLLPLLADKTVITIAHRLSTVKNAEMIYVLEDGKVVQRGSHKELEEEEGHYMEFVKKQLI